MGKSLETDVTLGNKGAAHASAMLQATVCTPGSPWKRAVLSNVKASTVPFMESEHMHLHC